MKPRKAVSLPAAEATLTQEGAIQLRLRAHLGGFSGTTGQILLNLTVEQATQVERVLAGILGKVRNKPPRVRLPC